MITLLLVVYFDNKFVQWNVQFVHWCTTLAQKLHTKKYEEGGNLYSFTVDSFPALQLNFAGTR